MKTFASIAMVLALVGGCSEEPLQPSTPQGHVDLTNPYDLRPLTGKQLAAAQANYQRIYDIVERDREPSLLKERGDPGSPEKTEWIIFRTALVAMGTGTLAGDRIKVVSCLIASGQNGAADLAADKFRFFAMWYGLKANDLGLWCRDGYAYFDKTLWPDIKWREKMRQDWRRWKDEKPHRFAYGRGEAMFVLWGRPDGEKVALAAHAMTALPGE